MVNFENLSAEASTQLEELTSSLAVTLQYLQEVSGNASDLVESKRPTLEQILVNLEETTRNLKKFSADPRRAAQRAGPRRQTQGSFRWRQMMRIKLVVPLMLLALGGCASAPDIDYYTLDMSPSGQVETDLNLVVGRFSTTESLGRSQIVIQASPTRIDYYATDRWASGVGEMVEHKLAAEFGPIVDGRRSLRVSGRVMAFEQVDAGIRRQGTGQIGVVIRDGQAKSYEAPLLEKTYEATRNADVQRRTPWCRRCRGRSKKSPPKSPPMLPGCDAAAAVVSRSAMDAEPG